MKITVRYLRNGAEHLIEATGLGDLGWQLDVAGVDTGAEDEGIDLLELSVRREPEGVRPRVLEAVSAADAALMDPPAGDVWNALRKARELLAEVKGLLS